jgi:hypothetical protein
MMQRLKKEIEAALGREMCTPKDFEYLRECVYSRLQVMISRTTLMRIWGYVDEKVVTRESTLGILAQFLGYRNWEEFQQNSSSSEAEGSNPVLSRRLNVTNELALGDCLRLTWQPGRVCDIKYLGELRFIVTASEKTRLKKGDTFECSLIVEGEPLYLDNLRQESHQPIAYVCGKKSGVRYDFPLIPDT